MVAETVTIEKLDEDATTAERSFFDIEILDFFSLGGPNIRDHVLENFINAYFRSIQNFWRFLFSHLTFGRSMQPTSITFHCCHGAADRSLEDLNSA